MCYYPILTEQQLCLSIPTVPARVFGHNVLLPGTTLGIAAQHSLDKFRRKLIAQECRQSILAENGDGRDDDTWSLPTLIAWQFDIEQVTPSNQKQPWRDLPMAILLHLYASNIPALIPLDSLLAFKERHVISDAPGR